MSADCCTYDCRQGRDCPARAACLKRPTSTPAAADDNADEFFDDTGLLVCQGLALVAFAVSMALYLLL